MPIRDSTSSSGLWRDRETVSFEGRVFVWAVPPSLCRVTAGSQFPGTSRSSGVTCGHPDAEICIRREHSGHRGTRSDTPPRRFGTVRPRVQRVLVGWIHCRSRSRGSVVSLGRGPDRKLRNADCGLAYAPRSAHTPAVRVRFRPWPRCSRKRIREQPGQSLATGRNSRPAFCIWQIATHGPHIAVLLSTPVTTHRSGQ
jgi:hypothetical protein